VTTVERSGPAIAIVGLGCRFPGARSPRELWENVLARRREFRRFPDSRLPLADYYDPAPRAPDKTYATRAAYIDGFEFDWVGRRVPQRTFVSTDIVHWLALDVALSALEDAGLTPETVPTERSTVLVGNTLTGEQTRASTMRLRWPYVRRALRAAAASRGLDDATRADVEFAMEEYYKSVFPTITEDTLAGTLSNTIAGRICNVLDFKGGGYTVDGACASGMLAVATAAAGLHRGDVDFALAGGVDVSLDAIELIGFAKVGALTRDDMNVYDRRGSGFIPGEGCGFVALERLEDARAAGREIYAVIRGWGISSDGKGGLTAPSRDAQALMVRRAYERAGYSPADLLFVEGHGTATVVGDKTELDAIQLAVDSGGGAPPGSIGMTSFKSLVGHMKAASGLGGLIKAVAAVNRRVLPPTAACTQPHKSFATTARSLYPVLTGRALDPSERVRAGASAMGFGGINCHVAIESADGPSAKLEPSLDERTLLGSSQDTELFLLAADSSEALRERVRSLVPVVATMSVAELTDLAAELAGAVRGAEVRAAVVAGSPIELMERLQELETTLAGAAEPAPGTRGTIAIGGEAVGSARVGFLFPGQGSQKLGMARMLVERHAWARELLARAQEWLDEVDGPQLAELVYRPVELAASTAELDEWNSALAQTEVAQPAITFASLLWLRHLERLGLRPAAVAGHSLGELTAFHAAGAFDERTLLQLAAVRGRAMAAGAGEAGAMASLACSLETAEAIVARVDGYVVVANVNSPSQVVVSGERAAVEHAVALAEADGVKTRVLAVSNAFHSRLVDGAAESLRADAPVPDELAETTVRLLTCTTGDDVAAGTALRDHFADQVVGRVDFVTLLRRIAEHCDVLIEVGPGRVLSGLAGATLGEDGPVCLPLESEARRDEDLNRGLAALFAHGVELDWARLYDDRLVRPFVPASELLFIDNPVERPFVVDGELAPPVSSVEDAALAAVPGIPTDVLREYLARRGGFLAQVIRADLELPAPATTPTASPAAPAEPVASTEAAPRAAETLLALVAEQTGFPADTLTPDLRLLDDLNLDSIKAAEVVVAAADRLGVSPPEPTEFANATLGEIAAALGGAGQALAPGKATETLLALVAEQTGFPADTLTPDLRLLDDLNLDSIKAAEVVVAAADRLGVAPPEPTEFANATLGEIAAALEAGGAPRADEGDVFADRPSWVRTFAVVEVREDVPAQHAHELSGARVLIRADDEAPLRAAFERLGAVMTESAEDATHLILVLPPEGSILERVRRLHAAAELAVPDERPRALVFIGPDVGAFAASLHHERPELRIRAIDAPVDERLADRVLVELAAGGSFERSRYDESGARLVQRPRVVDRAACTERPLEWSSQDVFLVTGGAKGITAECAFALAQATRARMALVGNSPQSEEVALTLDRYRADGLEGRYYRCDVTDATAVAALVERVRTELGPVTGLVHGAGANVARRVEQVGVDEAAAEIGPKLIGALNLLSALASSPPKLAIGFSSVTAVTGMPGNAWYGFANEGLDLALRRFAEEHPETAVLSLAYSIWGDVGMGARMGSASHLGRMGIAPIPTDEGVRRFVDLVQLDPGTPLAVVAARLRGLDTWRPEPRAKPVSDRFVEEVLQVEPGVEAVARARLTTVDDPYLEDHVYGGTPLLPAVFGLEAMAQAAALAAGVRQLDGVRIEDIRLERPVPVDPDGGAVIEVRGEVLEGDGVRVRASLGAEQSGFTVDHFSATFVLGAATQHDTEPMPATDGPLDIRPEDLSLILFQGPRFRRLTRIHSLDSKACVAEAEERDEPYLLGDPFFRDSLLQAALLVVSQSDCLPVEIDLIESAPPGAGIRLCRAVNDGRRDQTEHATIVAFDATGAVRQRIVGLRARILGERPDRPTPEELADPSQRDATLLRRRLAEAGPRLGVAVPEVSLRYLSGLHELSRDERHARELPLFTETVERHLQNGGRA
jgi:enediyne polyketide synthase